MIVIEPGQAYRLWAPTYSEETVISFIDKELGAELSPAVEGKRLLDAGCGTGRRMPRQNRGLAIGVDLSLEMLRAGKATIAAVADVRALPFPDRSFDVVWCRLVLGHLSDPRPAYQEFARVCRSGGMVFVTDFHAEAVAAGHRRIFRDQSGRQYAVEHHVHDGASHKRMGADAGLMMQAARDGVIGPGVQHLYARAGRVAAYEKDRGLPVVAAFLFERMG